MNEHRHHHSHVPPNVKPVELNLGTPDTERRIAALTPVTAVSWEYGRSFLDLPENLRGLRILDIGGGASEMTAAFLEGGVDAYAIDPRYKSRADLKGRALAQQRYHSHGKEHNREHQRIIERCMESMKENPQRYIGAMATELPFEDEFFDIVYSQATILGYLDVDFDLMTKAINEALRVTRHGGNVQLSPFGSIRDSGNGPQADMLRRSNHPKLLQWLSQNKPINHKVEDTGVLDFKRLTITKK